MPCTDSADSASPFLSVTTTDALASLAATLDPRWTYAEPIHVGGRWMASLIDRLDAPASADETIIRTFSLKNAKAEDAVKLMTGALQLDSKGRTQGEAEAEKGDSLVLFGAAIQRDQDRQRPRPLGAGQLHQDRQHDPTNLRSVPCPHK